jgi:hypothetical protein
MRIGYGWLVVVAFALSGSLTQAESSCDAADECTAKVCELDAAIEAARKEGSMRKLATLKDLRTEALRCSKKAKTE